MRPAQRRSTKARQADITARPTSAGLASAASVILFLYVVWLTLRSGEKVAANPWGPGATTLEWQLSSPPPFHSLDELPRLR